MPTDEVPPFDFRCWRMVLTTSLRAADAREYEARDPPHDDEPPSPAMNRGREQPFDPARPRDPAFSSPLERVRAVFGALCRADAQAARPFVSRARRYD